ncbi:transient receptor potential cation channel subfamily M member 7-like isoform X2 [Dreissena polymorpha]|uniref:transient receptor potential cation channel subfamily M member 7-like isoform X2 n=1 Tax=Dreissena polymorpha TaxID=45954 RepID=UPI00226496EA|nr:transient receptor potential cation channel subfamily M member 7-like isoform X2 [Dreissena polymorpha]
MTSNSESTRVEIDGTLVESAGQSSKYAIEFIDYDDDYYYESDDMSLTNESSEEMDDLISKQNDTRRNSETRHTTAFYKKTYTSGTISFIKKSNTTKCNIHLNDVKFIKIAAGKGNRDIDSILQTVAEGVVKKVWQLRHKNLLLSVDSVPHELDNEGHSAILNAIAGVLEGTCVVTDGTYDGLLVTNAVHKFEEKNEPLSCPRIGIICLDRIWNKETIKEPWEVKRGVFGIDSDGELFIVDTSKQRWTLNPASLTKVNVQRDGNTTTSPLTVDVHGNSSSPHFDVGDLVQIRNEPANWQRIYGLEKKHYTEATIGKIGIIVQVTKDNDLLIQVSGEHYSFWYKPDAVTLMTGKHFIDPLKKIFNKYRRLDVNDELVQAVSTDNVKKVYAIIRQAYTDFMEFTSMSFGVDCSGNFFVVDANGRTTFGPDDLNTDGNDIASSDVDHDFAHGDLVMIRGSESTAHWTDQKKRTIGKVGAIVLENNPDRAINVRVCGNIDWYHHSNLALVNQGRFDLLKEHFRNPEPYCVRDELQQAVYEGDRKKVTAIIRKAYKDSTRVCEYEDHVVNTVKRLSTENHLFVLVDNSTLNSFGWEELEFRAILEKQISSEMIRSRMNGDFNQYWEVLLVKLLFNDQTTAKTVKFAMEYDLPSVVVVTTDSDNCKRQDSAISDRKHQLREEVFNNLSKEYVRTPEGGQLFQAYKKERLLAVIHVSDMSTMLLQMIVDVVWKASSVRTRLLEWILNDQKRKTDMVIPLICAAGKPSKDDLYNKTPVLIASDIAFIMRYCLGCNDAECVRALIQPDVNMNSTWIEASQYTELCDDNDGLLKRLKSQDPIKWVMQRVKARPVRGEVEGHDAWKRVAYSADKEPKTEDVLPYWEYMFIWTLLLRKHKMAKILWAKTEHPLFMALIAHNLCKAVKKQTDDNVLIAEMEKELREWTTTAIEFLDKCYQDGDKPTYDHLKMAMPFWNERSCLDLAVDSRNMEVLAQQACRNLVDDVWNGQCTDDKLNQRQRPSSDTDLNKFSLNKMQAPKCKFVYNAISQLLFLFLFAYVLLFELTPNVSFSEYVLLTWVIAISVEELRQMLQMPGHKNDKTATQSVQLRTKLKNYILDGWNWIDIFTIILFVLGFGLRFAHFPDKIDYPRLVYAFDFAAFCIRLLYIFSIEKAIGPKIIIFKKMVKDLRHFYVIMVVFVVAYAITSYSILYPGAKITLANAKHLIRRPYWLLYGELTLDETEEFKDCTNDTGLWENGTTRLCPTETGRTYGPFMMGVYLMFSNILLLNILIAMFNYTFTKIQDKSEKIWCFQRFVVIKDYAQRPVLCPPLNLLSWPIYKLFQCCVTKRTKDELSDDHFHVPYDDKGLRKTNYGEGKQYLTLSKFMKEAHRSYLHKKKTESDTSMIETTANEKLDHLKNKNDELASLVLSLQDQLNRMQASIDNL